LRYELNITIRLKIFLPKAGNFNVVVSNHFYLIMNMVHYVQK
jgi:hypothetical protein